MSDLLEYLPGVTGFQWDAGNSEKNWLVHDVSQAETEQAFFNEPILLMTDVVHSRVEARYYLPGQTSSGRRLAVVFTIRNEMIRPIMARDMSRKERRLYEEQNAEEAT